jgi:hypothetical protein
MAELGTISAATGLLEQSIKLFRHVRETQQRIADLPGIIEEYTAAVQTSKTIVDLVQREPSLASPSVGTAIRGIANTTTSLNAHLSELQVLLDGSSARRFTHELFSGSDEQRQLQAIVDTLIRYKVDLIVGIGLVNVGLVHGYGNAVRVNTAAVEELNVRIKGILGDVGSLRIAKIIEGRPRDANGTVPLTTEDIAKIGDVKDGRLASEETVLPGSGRKIRCIENNIGLKGSLQLNTPVGNDIWINMDVIRVENNIADVGAAQYNYPISSHDFLESLKLMRQSQG